MKRTKTRHQPPLLDWVLCRGRQIIRCRLEQAGAMYRVSVVPHRKRRRLFTRLFDAGLSACQRHAAVVAELRGMGWTLVAYRP